jgi:hypothetical protein
MVSWDGYLALFGGKHSFHNIIFALLIAFHCSSYFIFSFEKYFNKSSGITVQTSQGLSIHLHQSLVLFLVK